MLRERVGPHLATGGERRWQVKISPQGVVLDGWNGTEEWALGDMFLLGLGGGPSRCLSYNQLGS